MHTALRAIRAEINGGTYAIPVSWIILQVNLQHGVLVGRYQSDDLVSLRFADCADGVAHKHDWSGGRAGFRRGWLRRGRSQGGGRANVGGKQGGAAQSAASRMTELKPEE